MDSKVLKTAAITAAFTLSITLSIQHLVHVYRTASLARKIKERASGSVTHELALNSAGVPETTMGPLEDSELQEIVNEQLARNRAFLGEEGVRNIQDSRVVVVGCGGVGSWVATMLARSGVMHLKIIDFDQVTLSSLNRHATATLEDVGTPKVDCVGKTIKRITPWVNVEPVIALWTRQAELENPLLGDADYVVDCIDNIDTKVDLLEWCVSKKIKVISSMGAGCKGDPTRIRIGDISMSIEDPLSRVVRRRLRLKGVITGIPVVFSNEKPGPGKAQLMQLDETEVEKGSINELSVLQDFRVRVLPVLGPLPGIFGLTIATHLLTELGGYNSVHDPVLGGYSMAGKNRTKLYESCLGSLVGQCARLGWGQSVPFDINDIGYLIEEVYCGKSIGGEVNRIALTKWDPALPLTLSNIVPVSKRQQQEHEKKIILGGLGYDSVYSEEEVRVRGKRGEIQAWYEQFRC